MGSTGLLGSGLVSIELLGSCLVTTWGLQGCIMLIMGILLGDHLRLVGVHEADKGVEGIVGKFEEHCSDKGVEDIHIGCKKAGKTDLEEVAYPRMVDNACTCCFSKPLLSSFDPLEVHSWDGITAFLLGMA